MIYIFFADFYCRLSEADEAFARQLIMVNDAILMIDMSFDCFFYISFPNSTSSLFGD